MSVLGNGSLTSIALCWRIERKDGAGLALTSHDEAVEVRGVRHDPAPGMTPAAVRHGGGLDAAKSEVAGALSSAAISEADLLAGRWDGAAVRLSAVDWERPAGSTELASGALGRISQKDREFHAEMLGPAAKLDSPVCPLTSPECRAELGDKACRVDMAGRSVRARVVSVDGLVVTVDRMLDDRFLMGSLRFLGGDANGLRSMLLKVDASTVTLRSMPPVTVIAGDAVEVIEGCDKSLETCSARFGNAANFRGEPHLPGNDLLTRYPGA
nr:DUF2163 domain-containing protein [uncultured Sphingomonas sp.]